MRLHPRNILRKPPPHTLPIPDTSVITCSRPNRSPSRQLSLSYIAGCTYSSMALPAAPHGRKSPLISHPLPGGLIDQRLIRHHGGTNSRHPRIYSAAVEPCQHIHHTRSRARPSMQGWGECPWWGRAKLTSPAAQSSDRQAGNGTDTDAATAKVRPPDRRGVWSPKGSKSAACIL